MAYPALAQEACHFAPMGTVTATAVRDSRTLLLSDGRELRLAAVELSDDSRAPLERLLLGRPLKLEGASAEPDHYGRLVAFACAGDGRPSAQQVLVSEGMARVAARVGNKACADALLAAERAARASNKGLWSNPNFALLPPENLTRLRAERGHFAIIEGKVLSVRVSGSTTYVNFGRRWTRDLSVIIARRNQRIFNTAGLEPSKLEGRSIRARGWLEQRRGAIIEVDAPEQIEIADQTMSDARETRQ